MKIKTNVRAGKQNRGSSSGEVEVEIQSPPVTRCTGI